MFRIISYLLISVLTLSAESTKPLVPKVVIKYEAAVTMSKQEKVPYALLIHGSSWHPASQKFIDKLWQNQEFTKTLPAPLLLTAIHIKQHQTKEQREADEANFKSWKNRKISSFPCIQIYNHDGTLLKTYTGSELRKISTDTALTAHLKNTVEAIIKREQLLQQITKARTDKDQKLEASLLTQVIQLPLNSDKNLIEQLKKADPKDSSGQIAKATFRGWSYIRHITGLIKAKKVPQALEETKAHLTNSTFDNNQLALAYGARGMALAANNDFVPAWNAFKQAKATDPNGPSGEAMLQHGARIALTPSRAGFPPNSEFFNTDIGDNLTRDNASFTLSSVDPSDNPDHHPSLFSGNFAPTGFAFHTKAEKEAAIIIDLKKVCTLKAAQIYNRTGRRVQQRAATLTISTSLDAKTWNKLWQADKAQDDWEIKLATTVSTRYVKIALNSPSPEHLHLRGVNLFGETQASKPQIP